MFVSGFLILEDCWRILDSPKGMCEKSVNTKAWSLNYTVDTVKSVLIPKSAWSLNCTLDTEDVEVFLKSYYSSIPCLLGLSLYDHPV